MLAPMSTARDMLAKYIKAENNLLEGKETRISNMSFRFEDLDKIRAGRQEWERKVLAERNRASGAATFGGLSFGRARLDRDE